MERASADRTALELLVHGVGGATPEKMLNDPRTVRITGDDTAAVFRRADDVGAETGPADDRGRAAPVPEAYVWSNLTSGNGTRALWLLLLPFMVVNLAHWMRPAAREGLRAVRLYGLLVRLAALSLTVLLVAAACEVALDLTAWQCAGTTACAERHSWLGFLSPAVSDGGWWSLPGRRLALAALVPTALVGLLWYLSHRTWRAYESQEPLDRAAEPENGPGHTALGRPGFWYGRRLVARLRAAHTAAGLLTVAAAVGTAAVRQDRRPGGPALLDALGRLLEASLVAGALATVWVVCRRGRSEHRLDRRIDAHLVHRLPSAALVLLALTLVYAGWERPGWHSDGRLPGDATFGGLALAQGALVIALAAVARVLHHCPRERSASAPASAPESPPADGDTAVERVQLAQQERCALRGLGGPAVAMLACALGGVMSGGVSQRVSDWLDGTGTFLDGPPVLLIWQAAVIPVLLVVLLVLCALLARQTWSLTRAEQEAVGRAYGVGRGDPARTRRIARARAMATLTDRGPLLVAVISTATLLLGAGALVGAFGTGKTPVRAGDGAPPFVQGVAQTAQAMGSWLIGLGFVLFVTWGRRAYKDASARRTIGILWDVGTFWPRAAHPSPRPATPSVPSPT